MSDSSTVASSAAQAHEHKNSEQGVTVIGLKPLSASSLTVNGKTLQAFDRVIFNEQIVNYITEKGIPYPKDWHMFLGVENDMAKFMGSMGGRFQLMPVVASKCITAVML